MSEDEDAENHIPCLREEANETATLDESNLKELLKMQISECEMLHSMFSNPEEFLLDCGLLVDIEDYIAGKTLEKPHQLNYTINFDVCQFKLEILVNLPLEYPHLEPEVFVRSAQLNRDQQKALNGNLKNFIANLERNEIIIGSVVAWLQENALEYFTIQNNETSSREPDKKSEEFEKRNKIFSRLWIYSHHIYSKVKRKMILDMADEYFLTGFCLPGKPGIICVEGYESDCNEWWQQIKNMTWKKIMCIKKEEFEIEKNIDNFKKFTNFQEISFNCNKVKKQDYHMDFGEFFKYLKENKCEYIFKEYFGMDGK